MMPLIRLLAVFFISLFDFFSYKFINKIKIDLDYLTNFSSGILIAFIVLQFLPEFFKITQLYFFAYLFFAFGFLSLFCLECFFKELHKPKNFFIALDLSIFCFKNFVSGLLIFFLLNSTELIFILLFMLPLLFESIYSSFALKLLSFKVHENIFLELFFSSFIFLGFFFGSFISFSETLFNSVFSFVIGSFVFVVFAKFFPKSKKRNPKYFIMGFLFVLIFSFLIFYLKNYFEVIK